MQLKKKLDGLDIKVIDVIILGIMDLGAFTSEEFNARPDNTELRQVLTGAMSGA
jgi:hypothetical protein